MGGKKYIWLLLLMPLSLAAEINLEYDANGNLVTGDGLYRVYNSFNQLWKIYNGSDESQLLQEYTYHPIEERVLMKKTFFPNGNLSERVIYVSKSFVQVKNSTGIFNFTYVYHEGQLVAQIVNGVTHFIHSDHLGSNTVVTDEEGVVIEKTQYTPFGEIIEGGEIVKRQYEGKEFDSVVGDTDFHFRKYKSEWGLFLQPDSLIAGTYDPQKLNHYMFEEGNPLKYIDPDRRDAEIFDIVGPNPHRIVAIYNENEGYATIYDYGPQGLNVLFGEAHINKFEDITLKGAIEKYETTMDRTTRNMPETKIISDPVVDKAGIQYADTLKAQADYGNLKYSLYGISNRQDLDKKFRQCRSFNEEVLSTMINKQTDINANLVSPPPKQAEVSIYDSKEITSTDIWHKVGKTIYGWNRAFGSAISSKTSNK